MKINLGVGAYRDDNGKPFVLPSVREAEKRILERNVDHEYAAIQGNDLFIKLSEKFVFGDESPVLKVLNPVLCLDSHSIRTIKLPQSNVYLELVR